jgi:hypothetical protein
LKVFFWSKSEYLAIAGKIIVKRRDTMEKQNKYVTADLSPNLINEIKSLEESLSEETHKKVFVIAYEKDENYLGE